MAARRCRRSSTAATWSASGRAAEFPGGTLIDRDHVQYEEKIADTRAALAAGAPAVFEASFSADGVFVAVDVLERRRSGFGIVEVKSTVETKDPHIPDTAIQLHVVRAAGLDVSRVEVMHLNRQCRFPDLSNLFVRDDVTAAAEAFLPAIPGHLARMRAALDGPLPVVEVGPHCDDPFECPFKARCWPEVGDDHVSHALLREPRRRPGCSPTASSRSRDIPAGTRLSEIQARQVRAIRSGQVVVEGDLAEDAGHAGAAHRLPRLRDHRARHPGLERLRPVHGDPGAAELPRGRRRPARPRTTSTSPTGPVTRGRRWPRRWCAPAPARTRWWPTTPRSSGAASSTSPSTSRSRRGALLEVTEKLVDLLPMVRDHVYHPAFGGGFSMKAVAPALVPGLDYAGLEIGEGGAASTALEALLLGGPAMSAAERDTVRAHLLEYCALDTWPW